MTVAAELGSLMKAKPPTGIREAMKLLGTALDLRHAKPKIGEDGPCKEVIQRFDAGEKEGRGESAANPPTLLNLPIQKCWPQDGGRFITFPCVVTRTIPTAASGTWACTGCRFTTNAAPGCTGSCKRSRARHGRRYYETGTRMPVAVFLGGDPVFTFCATAPVAGRAG